MVGKFGEMRRQDIPEYPVDDIREVLINELQDNTHHVLQKHQPIQ